MTPYVGLAATWRLWEEERVPYAVDFRDGWSIDVISGQRTFAPDSEAGRWEAKVLGDARAVWCVNDPIAAHYRELYPNIASRVRVVRNGFDLECIPAELRQPDPAGLAFGYLGSINVDAEFVALVLAAWRRARTEDPVVARSTWEIRGHTGMGVRREDNAVVELLRAAAADGVVFGGPVARADVASTYARWDVLVLMLVGGAYVTSGKVYEYAATGLPIVSVHTPDHDAARVLAGHPLWTGALGLDPDRLAAGFREGGRLALEASPGERTRARLHGRGLDRPSQLAPAVRELAAMVQDTAGRVLPA